MNGEALALDAIRQLAERDRQVAAMKATLLEALPVARDGGLSAQELADAWYLPRQMILRETDRVHRARRYT